MEYLLSLVDKIYLMPVRESKENCVRLKAGLTILFFHFMFLLHGQEIRISSTKEILQMKEQIGIDSTLMNIGLEIPIYRIDSVLALNFAYDYDKIKDEAVQTSFLSEVGLFLRSDSLSAKLIQRLIKYRTEFAAGSQPIPLIDYNLFFAIAFQKNIYSIASLKEEYDSWSSILESVRLTTNDENVQDTSMRRSIRIYEYNTFMIGWTLYKLKVKDFPAEKVNAISTDKRLRVQRTGPKIRHSTRTETLTLSKKYNSIAELDFVNDSSLAKMFGTLPASLKYSITLIYNSNTGILDFESWFNWQTRKGNSYRKAYEGQTCKIVLIAPDKIVVTWLSRYYS